jgi:hypothetical protein
MQSNDCMKMSMLILIRVSTVIIESMAIHLNIH